MKKQYTPFTKNGETFLREKNPYIFQPVPMFSGETRCENYQWGDFELTALSEAKVLLNPVDGKDVYLDSELMPVYQMQDTETGTWSTVRYITQLVDDLDSPVREAWKYTGLSAIDNAKVDGYTDGYGDGIDHERNRIIGIIEGAKISAGANKKEINDHLDYILSKINDNGK